MKAYSPASLEKTTVWLSPVFVRHAERVIRTVEFHTHQNLFRADGHEEIILKIDDNEEMKQQSGKQNTASRMPIQ